MWKAVYVEDPELLWRKLGRSLPQGDLHHLYEDGVTAADEERLLSCGLKLINFGEDEPDLSRVQWDIESRSFKKRRPSPGPHPAAAQLRAWDLLAKGPKRWGWRDYAACLSLILELVASGVRL